MEAELSTGVDVLVLDIWRPRQQFVLEIWHDIEVLWAVDLSYIYLPIALAHRLHSHFCVGASFGCCVYNLPRVLFLLVALGCPWNGRESDESLASAMIFVSGLDSGIP